MKNIRPIFGYGIIIIVFILLLSIFHKNHQNTIQIIKSEYEAKHRLVEESIYNTIKYADSIDQIIEEELNTKMRDYSLVMLEKYRQDPNVLNWQLDELKNRFGNYDIYIINRDLKIIKTTLNSDLGLDFKKFPSFSRLLESRLQGSEFMVDQMDISTASGELMKYSYMPTPDHQYLFELSINITNRFPVMNNLDIFSVASNLTDQYPSVDKITIYKYTESGNGILKISKDKPYYSKVDDNNKEAHIKEALRSNQAQIETITANSSKTTYTHKYIPYLTYKNDGEYNWWNSYVIEIIYNDNVMLKDINKEKSLFWQSILIIAAIYFAFIFIVIHFTRKSEHMAYHDHLTKLPNRKLFEEYFHQRIAGAKRNKRKLAVLFLDLNSFKKINDTYGHSIGDRLLQEVAKRLKNNLRKSDIISRLGGDEFIVLLSEIEAKEDALNVALKINNISKKPIKINQHEILVELSIGISIYPDDSDKPETLIQKADIAMYQAKKQKLN